jgi:hypothetical protein
VQRQLVPLKVIFDGQTQLELIRTNGETQAQKVVSKEGKMPSVKLP